MRDAVGLLYWLLIVYFVGLLFMIQMYSPEDATDVEAPSLGDKQRYEYKQLMMNALANVCNIYVLNYCQ